MGTFTFGEREIREARAKKIVRLAALLASNKIVSEQVDFIGEGGDLPIDAE